MSDFLLEPDELDPERPERSRLVRLVSTGVAPTAEVPPSTRRGPDHPPCYVPCEACGAPGLMGTASAGTRLALDTQARTYTVHWPPGTPEPILNGSTAGRCSTRAADACGESGLTHVCGHAEDGGGV